jgi:hypothetical protein
MIVDPYRFAPAAPDGLLAGSSTYASADASATHTIPLPGASGDLIVMAVCPGGSTSFSTPSGWSAVATRSQVSSSVGRAYIIAKISAGESSIELTISSSTSLAAAAVAVASPHGDIVGAFTASNTTIDPPSVSTAWGSEDALALAFCRPQLVTVTTAPIGYSELAATAVSEGSAVARSCAWAAKAISGSSEDPGEFALSGSSDATYAATVLVRLA